MKRRTIVIALGLTSSGTAWPQQSPDLATAKDLERLKAEYGDVLALQGTSRDGSTASQDLAAGSPDIATVKEKDKTGEAPSNEAHENAGWPHRTYCWHVSPWFVGTTPWMTCEGRISICRAERRDLPRSRHPSCTRSCRAGSAA